MRQHVNPLSSFFQIPIKLPEPKELFLEAKKPIHLDIGCARGQFLLEMAIRNPDWNFLGLEIREALAISAEEKRKEMELDNLRFIFCNANISLSQWLSSLPRNKLQRGSIQFPDPWFKKRHQKRRLLQASLLLSIADALQPGTELFIQSDILDVIESMSNLIETSGFFDLTIYKNSKWLDQNPFLVSTEREIYVQRKGIDIYRLLYVRNQKRFLQ